MLTNVILPKTLREICNSAFTNTSLTSIVIPKSVTTLATDAISVPTLNSIQVEEGNPNYYSQNNAIYEKSTGKLVRGCRASGIPEGVKEIGAGAFYRCTSMTDITFPNTLKFVGTSAFSECTGLKTIEFPESVTQINYGFYNCKNLDVIINNYKENVIVDSTFFKDVKSVTFLDPRISTSDLFKFEVLTDSTVEIIKDASYKAASFPDSIEIPSKVRIGNTIYTVTSIGYEAFRECSNLSYVKIPESIKSIDTWAFYDCTGLESKMLIYNNGTKCYGWVGNRSVCKTVEIPTGVKEIGDAAFYSLKNLTSVTIPNTVISLGTSAFSECSSLTKIEIPESVTQINYGFYNCKKLDVIIHNSEENVNIDKSFYKDVKSVKFTNEIYKIRIIAK